MGHALEFVQADAIKRYYNLLGYDTFLVTGGDENSIKNVRAAEKLKITPQQLVDKNSAIFRELADKIGLSYDAFVKSSDKKAHWPGVYDVWNRITKNGDVYKKSYSGLYCSGCEQFYTEHELIDGKCPEHGTAPERVDEENYFFKLSAYQDKLKRLIESDELKIFPQSRKNEILSFINSGLEDFSISRSVKRAQGWGVPVPDDASQIIYVWVDALSCYITGVGFGTDEKKFGEWWPAEVHVIGKGIIRFHAVYWPAILLSAGIPLPKKIFVHGYFTVDGKKMSKSLGNVTNPLDLLSRYTADELRYYLIKGISTFEDGDFSEGGLKESINKELLGDLGNLVNRVLTIAEKSGAERFAGKNELEAKLNLDDIQISLNNLELHEALEKIMGFVRECNRYVNEKAPWKLEGNELNQALYNLLESIRISSILLYPFIPQTSERISQKLGLKLGNIDDCRFRNEFKEKVSKGDLLFTKRE